MQPVITVNVVVNNNPATTVATSATTVATSATTVATTTTTTTARAARSGPILFRTRRHWRSAWCKVVLILRRRKAWAAEGQALKAAWIQDLVEGLERVRGKLVRKAIAPLRTR